MKVIKRTVTQQKPAQWICYECSSLIESELHEAEGFNENENTSKEENINFVCPVCNTANRMWKSRFFEQVTTSEEEASLIVFPKHAGSLELQHNPHLNKYTTVREWVSSPDISELYDWRSNEHQQRSFKLNEVWTLQWYPDTPVGFIAIAAPTLAELLQYALPR